MADSRHGAGGTLHTHRHTPGRGRCLYETTLRQAIAVQYDLADADGLELRMCEGCGRAFLLRAVWQPFTEEGEIACPRCGTLAVEWDGTRGYVTYWHRELGLDLGGG